MRKPIRTQKLVIPTVRILKSKQYTVSPLCEENYSVSLWDVPDNFTKECYKCTKEVP